MTLTTSVIPGKCAAHGGPRFRDKCGDKPSSTCLRQQFARLKGSLKKAQNAKNWDRVIEVCDQFDRMLDTYATPDWWHIFDIARRDAEYEKRRSSDIW